MIVKFIPVKMPGLVQESPFKTITVKELHPTFGAEIEGADFENTTNEQFEEIKAALAKVCGLFLPALSYTHLGTDEHASMASLCSATQD